MLHTSRKQHFRISYCKYRYYILFSMYILSYITQIFLVVAAKRVLCRTFSTSNKDVDIAIIGGGIVGAALAAKLRTIILYR